MRPFSERYGCDRGQPVARWYIDRFIADHQSDIKGEVIELLDGYYARNLGAQTVERIEILDIDEGNRAATLIADLGQKDSLPQDAYDCFILTQTLHLVPRLDIAIRNALESLRPGGVLLITTPVIAPLDPIYGYERDYWRLSPAGLREQLIQNGATDPEVTSYGNLLVCVATLLGLASEELTIEELQKDDSAYPLIACARVKKAR